MTTDTTTELDAPSALDALPASSEKASAPPPKRRRPRSLSERVLRVGLLFGAIGALFSSSIPLCPVAMGLHEPCPGCGLTRATLASMHGHFGDAFRFHPLVFLVVPILATWTVTSVWRYLREGVALPPPRVSRYLSPATALLWALLIVLWVLRWRGYFGGPVPV